MLEVFNKIRMLPLVWCNRVNLCFFDFLREGFDEQFLDEENLEINSILHVDLNELESGKFLVKEINELSFACAFKF